MKKQVGYWQEFFKGIWEINPAFKQMLGLCPTLAVTVSAINGIAMALATTFVLVFSSFLISCLRRLIPNQVRIASYIVIIATFVTIADLMMKARFPALSKALGPFVPLIVVNCLILGRAEAFASKNTPSRAIFDALGNGTGFLIALTIIGSIRELLGSRTIFGYQILPSSFEPILVMILPAGAFITLGLLMGVVNAYTLKRKSYEHQLLIDKYRNTYSTHNEVQNV
jgi:electron transport complex protein RnfE